MDNKIMRGSSVIVKMEARSYFGNELAPHISNTKYRVIDTNGDIAVVAKGSLVVAVVGIDDLISQ